MKRDLRAYARQTNVRLAAGAVFLLFGVGLGLIWLFFGDRAASLGFICLLAALLPVLIIIVVFYAIEWILKHARPD